jgi:TonB family protein
MAMIKFLHTNLHYPDSALAYDIQGRVMVRLKILSNGAVDSVHVTSHPNPYLDGEAVRVFKLLHFSPATDTTLDLYMELPIDFRF